MRFQRVSFYSDNVHTNLTFTVDQTEFGAQSATFTLFGIRMILPIRAFE